MWFAMTHASPVTMTHASPMTMTHASPLLYFQDFTSYSQLLYNLVHLALHLLLQIDYFQDRGPI